MRREFDIRVTSYSEDEFRVSGKDFKHLLEEYNRDQLYKKFGILFKKFVNDSIDEDDSGTYIFTVVDSKKMSMLSLKHGITGSVNTITNVCQKVHDLL
jgi:hypothetical protein